MKIAIVGVGLYGAYIADMLSNNKKFSVDLYDAKKEILSVTAKKNQYRLHIGYHYPRSKETILQTLNGFKIFKKKFQKFLYFPKKNYYLIHKNSPINLKEYLKIYKSFNLGFKKITLNKYSEYINENQIEGCVNTEEGVILIDKLIPYLRNKLKKKTNIFRRKLIKKIDNLNGLIYFDNNKKKYDLIINATYQNPNLGLIKNKFNLKYELTGLVKISKPFKDQVGLTIMDGPYCSLYPQNKHSSTISSVIYTPIYKSNSFDKLKKKLLTLDKKKIKKNIINHASKFFNFKNKNMKSELILSHKVKLKNDINDKRTSSIIVENKLISILCGKIDAAPLIYDQIEKIIKNKLSV